MKVKTQLGEGHTSQWVALVTPESSEAYIMKNQGAYIEIVGKRLVCGYIQENEDKETYDHLGPFPTEAHILRLIDKYERRYGKLCGGNGS